jgi:small-conductance mechanosensitive channel
MNHCLKTDTMRFRRFINENRGWQASIEVHQREIPEMQQLLAEAEAEVLLSPQERDACRYHFRELLQHQQEEMQQVRHELDEQQKRLSADCATDAIYDIEALCCQDIIRDRVKELHKTFVDLKCSFMSFLSTAL